MLACSSTDGTVSFLLFSEEDLGARLADEEMQAMLRKLYGEAAFDANMASTALVEDPALLMAGSQHSQHSQPATGKYLILVSIFCFDFLF